MPTRAEVPLGSHPAPRAGHPWGPPAPSPLPWALSPHCDPPNFFHGAHPITVNPQTYSMGLIPSL